MQPIQDQPTEEIPQPTQYISPARLAANRANSQKSTGPRTPAGKRRSASNSLQHGLYSLKNFDSFIHDNDLALTVITNYLEQFERVTPTEHTLVHQLIHQQLRFLQMEYLFNQAMSFRVEQILKTPFPFLPQIMRELDRLPARIQRTIKAIHAEQKRPLDQDWEIEAIAGQPTLPERSDNEVYAALVTDKGVVAMNNGDQNRRRPPLPHPRRSRSQHIPATPARKSRKRTRALSNTSLGSVDKPRRACALTSCQILIKTPTLVLRGLLPQIRSTTSPIANSTMLMLWT